MPKRKIATEYFVLGLAWLFWGTSQSLLRIENSKKNDSLLIVCIVGAQAFIFFMANLFTINTIDWVRQRIKGAWCQYSSSVLIIIATALLAVFLNVSIYNYANGKKEIIKPLPSYLTNGLEKIIFIAGFSTTFFLIRNLKAYQKQQSILQQAQQTARDAQLQMLQQQLNPHFLFNTLNSLRSLITIDKDRARGMVTDLSEFLRVTLSSYKSVRNTVQDEVGLVTYYLKIQKIRFEEELDYEIDIDTGTEHLTIPKFIFQPLVENAVKYGMLTSTMPLLITIKTKRVQNQLLIRITNTGKLASSSTEKHANNGISNTKTRLELMYPEQSSFSLQEQEGQVVAEIIIPIS